MLIQISGADKATRAGPQPGSGVKTEIILKCRYVNMFDHVQIKVADLARSRAFYLATLGALGYGVVFEIPDVVVGFGLDVHNMFEIRQASADAKLTCEVHLAFKAADEAKVRAFYQAALEMGGTGNGLPDLRPDYEPDYYAAFVLDPDGNNIEAVTKKRGD